jgi:hypothetical protein
MKIGNRKEKTTSMSTNPNKNASKKNLLLLAIVAVTAVLIVWVYSMGKKAEETVQVVMWSEDIYKNETITESQLEPYSMLKAEFEKYAVTDDDGNKTRRIVLWDERDLLLDTFAAYSLHQDTIAMITDVIASRTDNSDTVLYSYPGKNIVAMTLADGDLNTYKKFLEIGDRVNIVAIYKNESEITDENGEKTTYETYSQEKVFEDIMIADMLNGDGDSVLDLMAEYNDLTVYEQAALDSDEDWQSSIEPSTLLVALTPEEESLYYQYLAMSDCEFRMSLPQRTE